MSYQPKFKILSVGTILTDGKFILIGHATGTKNWDIPKGKQEEGESNIETAERELLEETGLAFNRKRFEVIGLYELNKHKNLYLYRIKFHDLEKEIDISKLKCKSFFHRDNGDKVLEFDRYKIIKIKDIEEYCPKNLKRVLKEVL